MQTAGNVAPSCDPPPLDRWQDHRAPRAATCDPAGSQTIRPSEFETGAGDTRGAIAAQWEDGWARVLNTIALLAPDDLSKTIYVRGEAHSVLEAINRQTSHYAAHVGQIVLLAKHYAGSKWETLSIPRGKSKEFDVAKSGKSYDVKNK